MALQALNRNSFARVYDSGSMVALPVLGMRELGRISPPLILLPGDQLSFYISYPVGGGITLTGGGGTYSFGGGASFSVPAGVGSHTIISGSVPSIPDGCYKMTIGGMESNYAEVVNDVSYANQISAFFEISHNKTLGQFYYPYAGLNYRQRLRLRVSLSELQSESSVEVYEETNTGKLRNLQGVYKEYVSFRTPEYELEDHQAMMMLAMHDNIKINGRNYSRRPSGSYQANYDMSTPTSDGQFSLYDNDATFLIRA